MTTTDEILEHREALLDNIQELSEAARELVSAVEQYVEPKPGQPYMHRMRLLNINNKLKKLL